MSLKETARKIAKAPAALASRQNQTVEQPPEAGPPVFQAWSEPNAEDIGSAGDQRRAAARALAASDLYQNPHREPQWRDPRRIGATE